MLPEPQLPDPLPPEPMVLLAEWFAEALRLREQPNPDAMVLATVADGQPSARVVLCKQIEPDSGTLRFYTNYDSRKGRELAANPRAAVVFHWDHLSRQARLEGQVEKSSAADSDAYFSSRPRDSQVGAHASRQSQPIDSLAALRAQAEAARQRFGSGPVPRPAHWGGFIFRAESVELWAGGAARLHQRARWTRELSVSCSARPVAGPWSVSRLQP
jgi:pyridoxamine 5'-phosphate oxidase